MFSGPEEGQRITELDKEDATNESESSHRPRTTLEVPDPVGDTVTVLLEFGEEGVGVLLPSAHVLGS